MVAPSSFRAEDMELIVVATSTSKSPDVVLVMELRTVVSSFPLAASVNRVTTDLAKAQKDVQLSKAAWK